MATERVCSIEGCGNAHLARGMCSNHYWAWKRRNPTAPRAYPRRADSYPGTCLEWLEDHVGYDGAGCLIWPWSRCDAGYGNIKFRGRRTRANRVMCILAHGEPPTPEYEAAHSCGGGRLGCVHPGHLRWASVLENAHDKIAHGTWTHGEDVHSAKLTEGQVREIRRLALEMTKTDIARIYGVSRSAISMIVSRKHWGWLS